MSRPDRPGREPRTGGFREVLRSSPYRRLLSVRLSSQLGDGTFQAGLASFLLFNPTEAPTAPLVAGALSVTVLPFTIVGPFAGVLLDRWSRQRVLLVSNLVRTVLVALVAAVVLAGGGQFSGGVLVALYVLVLTTLTVNRFLLAGLGASLPQTVEARLLVPANAITPTLGTAAFGSGFGLGLLVRLLLGSGVGTDAAILGLGAALFLAAALLTLRIGGRALGPDEQTEASTGEAAVAVLRGLREGAVHLWRRPAPRNAIGVIGAHRFAFGISTIATFLLARGYLSDDVDVGLGILGLAGGAAAVGALLAAVLTPTAIRRLEALPPSRRAGLSSLDAWVALALFLAFGVEILYTLGVAVWSLAAGALMLGLAGQVVKIATDTHVQTGVEESVRGRAFAFYDVVFNASFILAAALGALVIPDDGYSRLLYAFIATVYLVTGLAYLRAARRTAPDAAEASRGVADRAG